MGGKGLVVGDLAYSLVEGQSMTWSWSNDAHKYAIAVSCSVFVMSIVLSRENTRPESDQINSNQTSILSVITSHNDQAVRSAISGIMSTRLVDTLILKGCEADKWHVPPCPMR